ncbi:unnamed protein product [Allacma fusca]|uniref:Uncharacterized protein n=1 Tax=Allacma fusca TaxID=39272 RepID=A0A8J2K039_9HEXA|nr:unnamed protein product [Allacma fusca]
MERQTPIIKTSERYVPQFKQKVLDYLNPDSSSRSKVTINAAAKKFRVHPTTISDWVQDNKRQLEMNTLHENLQNADDVLPLTAIPDDSNQQSSIYSTIENNLIHWLQFQRAESCQLDSHSIGDKIFDLLQQYKSNINSDPTLRTELLWLILLLDKLRQTMPAYDGFQSVEDLRLELDPKWMKCSRIQIEIGDLIIDIQK